MQLVMFSKMLKRTGGLSIPEAGDVIAELGFDGVDLTVRPGGHVAPEEARERLPESIDVLAESGLDVPMITTSITDADEAYAKEVFATADDNDVSYLKLGYWRYDGFGALHTQLESMREDLIRLSELGERYSVTPLVHTHSGDFLSVNPAFLWNLLRETDREYLGMYIDPGHLVVEGGKSGW